MKKAILILLLLPIIASSQTFNVFDIDTTDYPVMKAKFFSTDVNNNTLMNFTTSDFEITENGNPAEVLSVSCIPEKSIQSSIVVAVDISGSMRGEELEILKNSIKHFVDLIPDDGTELCITAFNSGNHFISDFSTNKTVLKSKIDDLSAGGGTDFDAAFLNPMAGALLAVENGRFLNKSVIIITDGFASGDENKIISKGKSIKSRVFGILVNNEAPVILKNIFRETGGKSFDNIITESDYNESFRSLNLMINNKPCDISWQAIPSCKPTIDVVVENKVNDLTSALSYKLNKEQQVTFTIGSYLIAFDKETQDTTIEITSNSGTQIINTIFFLPDNGSFSVTTPLPITIPKNGTVELKINKIIQDDKKEYVKMGIISDYCSTSVGLLRGDKHSKISEKTINLTYPNGGEHFVAGEDTTITWEGISEREIVELNFSSNSGKKWESITKNATNNSYGWTLPIIESDSCLVNVIQNENYEQYETSDIIWDKALGGSNEDYANSIVSVSDGGYIVVGNSSSIDKDISKPVGRNDFWIVKIDSESELLWERSFGTGIDDTAKAIIETKGGDFVIVGSSKSGKSGTSYPGRNDDYWICKISSTGELIWEKTYGGTSKEIANSVVEATDGGFVVAGYSSSEDGDITNPQGRADCWLIKLDANGELLWQKSYGGIHHEEINSIVQTIDGGYIVAGTISSIGVNPKSKGDYDYWVLKFDANGNLERENYYGGRGKDVAHSIQETFDYGYIISGFSESEGDDITNSKGEEDCWIVKTDSEGIIEWEKSLGGSGNDGANSVVQTNDGGYIVAGYSISQDGDISDPLGYYDYWVAKLNAVGELEWGRNYGGITDDRATDVALTNDGNYIVAGFTRSISGDVSNHNGAIDYWVVKIAAAPNVLQSDTSDALFSIIMPKPEIRITDVNMGEVTVGNTKDTTVSSVICNTGDAPLHVLGVDITGGDATDFLIPRGAGDFYLEKDQCQDMMFEFTPSALGNRTAVATIRTTIGDFSDTINIRGVGINPLIEASTDVVDFGKIRLGLSKDTTVYLLENKTNRDIIITNTSLLGPDMEQFEILTLDKSFIVPANGTKSLDLEYTAQYIGKANSSIDFEYEGAHEPLRSLLFAEGIDDVVEIYADTIDFGEVEIGLLKDTNAYAIKNISSNDVLVSDITLKGPDLEQFSIEESDTDFVIESYDSLRINLRFTALKPGLSNTTIESKNHLTATTLTFVLIGRGVGGKVTPAIVDSYIGEASDLRINLSEIEPDLLSEIATSFTATVSYNSTLLAPIDKNMTVTTENTTSFIELEGQLSGAAQIATVPMKVGLGTAISSGLVVTEFQLYDANGDSVDYQIEPGVGEFNVLGICEEGGTRLVNPNGEQVEMIVSQDQMNTSATVSLNLIESGQTDLIIYDQLGNAIETAYSGTPNTGTKELTLDLSNFANGRYYIKLITPTITKTEIIEIVR